MENLQLLTEIIISAGIVQGFFIALLYRDYKRKHNHFLLSLLSISLSLIVFNIYYLDSYFYNRIGPFFLFAGPFIFLLGPFLFFYLRNIVFPKSNIIRKDIIHFALFIFFIAITIPVYFDGTDQFYSLFLQRLIGSPWIFLVIQFGYYLVKARSLVRLHKNNIVEKFSNFEGRDVSWLNLIIWIFIIIFVFITVATPWLLHNINISYFKYISSFFFSLILFFIAYKGLRQRIPTESIDTIKNEIETSSEDIQRLKEKLISHMEINKPYLNPELTLVDLAKQIGIGRNQLSEVINAGVGDNFYNFINKFRIEEVKQLFIDDSRKRYKIIYLATKAGFNSKSSFNHIFKKITGLTPSEYRNGQN